MLAITNTIKMKTKLLLLLLLLTNTIFSQKVKESIQTKKLGTRNFTVITPASYESNKEKKYPLLLLLDGEYLLSPFEGVLNYGNYWDDLPEMLIVAIDQNYNEVRFDDSQFDLKGLPFEKGADFFEFIGVELIPMIEQKYRTLPFRIIAGHDTTAGFLNFYLYKDNPVFNGYISLAPEMAPAMETRVAERLSKITKPTFYYQATGDGDLPEINEKVTILDKNIKAFENPNLKYRNDTFKETTHYSVVTKAIPNALYFIFEGYQPISMLEFQNKIANLESGYTNYLIEKYNYLDNMGLQVKPRLSDFKAIEAAILKNKAFMELQPLADYADKKYPKTTLGTYHQALYFEKTGNFKKALKTYQKSFALEEVRELTKDFLMARADALKGKEDAPAEDSPIEAIEETPVEKKE